MIRRWRHGDNHRLTLVILLATARCLHTLWHCTTLVHITSTLSSTLVYHLHFTALSDTSPSSQVELEQVIFAFAVSDAQSAEDHKSGAGRGAEAMYRYALAQVYKVCIMSSVLWISITIPLLSLSFSFFFSFFLPFSLSFFLCFFLFCFLSFPSSIFSYLFSPFFATSFFPYKCSFFLPALFRYLCPPSLHTSLFTVTPHHHHPLPIPLSNRPFITNIPIPVGEGPVLVYPNCTTATATCTAGTTSPKKQ